MVIMDTRSGFALALAPTAFSRLLLLAVLPLLVLPSSPGALSSSAFAWSIHHPTVARRRIISDDCGRLAASPPLPQSALRASSKAASEEGRSNSSIDAINGDDNSKRIYSMPAMYDLAFSYRDYDGEVDFLLDVHNRISSGGDGESAETISVLELGAGPARHSISALTRDLVSRVYCIDLSPEMKQYALGIISNEDIIANGEEQSTKRFHYLTQDMRSFQLGEGGVENEGDGGNGVAVDAAWILLGSLQHLLSNDDVIKCFKSVHRALRPGGTMVVELPHPRETFSMVECTRNGWEVPLEDELGRQSGSLKIIWGDDDDVFDPITQVRQFTVKMKLAGMPMDKKRKKTKKRQRGDSDGNDDGESAQQRSVNEVVPTRLFTAQEIDALARCSGFEVVDTFGALEADVDVNDEDAAFRLVCVMQRR